MRLKKILAELIAILGAASTSYSAFLVSQPLGFLIVGLWMLLFSASLFQGVAK